jgi:hypothetical protein
MGGAEPVRTTLGSLVCPHVSGSDPSPLDVDVLAASLRADAADLDEFAELLAVKLERALPGRTRVERRRAGLRGPRRVRRIEVALPSERLELVSGEGSVQASWARVSGGIVLKHEPVELDEWVRRLSGALAGEAERSQDASSGTTAAIRPSRARHRSHGPPHRRTRRRRGAMRRARSPTFPRPAAREWRG